MPKRSDLEKQVADLQAALDKALRGEAEVSGANGIVCAKLDEAEKALARTHESRDEAWKRVGELERRVAEQDVMLRTLAEENATLKAAVEDRFAGAEWDTGPESMGVLLRRANERADALETRLAVLQAANEAADRHAGAEPWIGEKTRAEAAS